jgi:hypothetical protein
VKAAVAAGVVALGGSALAAGGGKDDKVASSGKVATDAKANVIRLDVAKVKVRALAAGLNSFFSRISPDANPGRNVLTISGLPAGTRVISVRMTEWAPGDTPHAGGAFCYTSSAQLYNNGTQCRVVFNLDWGDHLPAACQVIYGPG